MIILGLIALATIGLFRAFGATLAEKARAQGDAILGLGATQPSLVASGGPSPSAPWAQTPAMARPDGVATASPEARPKTGAVSGQGSPGSLALADPRPGEDDDPLQITTPLTTSGSNAATEATYSVGTATHPPIHHDNGFLQNPADPNDPTPRPTRPSTSEERAAYGKQVLKADLGLAAANAHLPDWAVPDEYEKFLDLPDGLEAYNHFLTGNGADHQFSYDKFVRDDKSGAAVLDNAIGDTQEGAEELYRQMLLDDPTLGDAPITFELTGDAVSVRAGNEEYPYPATENWQKAIGAHTIWNSAKVTVTPSSTPGGPPQFSMDYALHAEDRYNFNPGAADIATGQPDSDNGRFEESGLAKQYMNYGTLDRSVTWTQGNVASSTKVADGSSR